MDIVYALYRKHNTSAKIHSEFESLHDGDTLCSVSSQNIVAFTTRTELDDVSGKTWGSHVYVADLNTPWFSHKVISRESVVTALEWDLPGYKLLIADASGVVSLWALREHVLNDWVCLGNIAYPGEHMIGAAFFHNGKKIVIVPEKKDNYQYSEKFSHVRFAPSVRKFGGRPVEGCLVISSTGMVAALALSKDQVPVLSTTTESLGPTRSHITAVDICYGKNGQYLVAVSSGSIKMPIQCFRVSVKRVDDKLTISSQALPSFFMKTSSSPNNAYLNVTQVKFVVREDADTLVVAANSDTGALIEIWELQEKPLTIHKLFQAKLQSSEPFKTVLWQHQSQYSLSTPITCMTTLKMALTNTVPPPLYVIVVLTDGSIYCLTRESLKQVATSYMALGWRDDVKHQKLNIDISHIDMTWLGGALVVTDTQGQLYLYRLHPIGEPGSAMSITYAVSLLEYCLVTGLDWWDILIALRPQTVEAVCDRLADSFNRQSLAIQQYHMSNQLALRAALCRLSPQSQSRAADLTALLMLHAVSTAFKSLLRPSDLSSHDKSPADSLQDPVTDSFTCEVCGHVYTRKDHLTRHLRLMHSEHRSFYCSMCGAQFPRRDTLVRHMATVHRQHLVQPAAPSKLKGAVITLPASSRPRKSRSVPNSTPPKSSSPQRSPDPAVINEGLTDIDQVLLHLEAKEFTVEPSTLQSLHQLIQWVADLALNLLARLPEHRKSIGYELVRDSKAVNSIRELLIIMRFWGLVRNSCLPIFISSAENVDVLGLLFKLLSRLVQSPEPDDTLIDECILLPNQVMIPPLNTATPITAVTSPALFYLSLPLKLEFGMEPDCLLFVPDLSPVEGAMATDQTVDTIRHIYLGHQPLVVKQCCRCGGKAQLQNSQRKAAIRAWDQRWVRSCRCGGHWRIHKFA